MSFDWSEYQTLAEELRQRSGEAAQRSAISRIYYAVYWRARNFLENEGFFYRQYDSSHRQIWDEFKFRGRTFNAIGRSGDLLPANRVSADYSDEINNLDKLVEQSFELAEKVNSYLEQVENKPTN